MFIIPNLYWTTASISRCFLRHSGKAEINIELIEMFSEKKKNALCHYLLLELKNAFQEIVMERRIVSYRMNDHLTLEGTVSPTRLHLVSFVSE